MKNIIVSIVCTGIMGLLACSSGGNVEIVRPDPSELYDLTFDFNTYIIPDNFISEVNNPLFPQIIGTKRIIRGENEDAESVEVVEEVLPSIKTILGIDCTIVLVKEWENGELVEETWDFYSQDKDGNVWYFGEEVDNYDDGQLTDHNGAWEAGVDGAIPGIIMPAMLVVGMKYRQEFYENEAEDVAEVISLDENLTISYGTYSKVLKTEEWTPLEPAAREYKYYAEGVGFLKAESLTDPSFEELEELTN